MRSPSKASRAAYKRCPETCQKVRAEISEALEKVLVASLGENYSCKFLAELTDAAFDAALAHGTEPLRDALVDCEEELMETKSLLSTADDEASYWRGDSERLQSELDSIPST
jgi:hypothetical protein